jgi:hypothetical protein
MDLFNLDVRTLLFCFILSKPLVYTMLELKKKKPMVDGWHFLGQI